MLSFVKFLAAKILAFVDNLEAKADTSSALPVYFVRIALYYIAPLYTYTDGLYIIREFA